MRLSLYKPQDVWGLSGTFQSEGDYHGNQAFLLNITGEQNQMSQEVITTNGSSNKYEHICNIQQFCINNSIIKSYDFYNEITTFESG